MDNETFRTTPLFMKGSWIYKNENAANDEKMELYISENKCSLIKILNGKEVENISFNGNAHWFGYWLCFMNSTHQFYVKYADADILVFGEYEGEIIGNYLWEQKFTRS